MEFGRQHTYSPCVSRAHEFSGGSVSCRHNPQSLASQTYDGNGNLTYDGTWTYAYDSENRLVTAQAASKGVNAAYAYDPLGRRTEKYGAGVTTTLFLNDGSDEIAEYDGAGDVLRRFVPGPAINEPIAYENCAGATAPHCTGSVSFEYFHTDHHGSVIATSGASAAPIEGPFTYDAFGNGGPLTGEPFKYVGMYLDAETGLYYDRARYYSPSLGRFLQTDPIGYKDDLDMYTYVGNDPTDKSDPTGMVCTSSSSNGNDVTTCTPNNFDSSKAKDQTIGAPDRAVNALVANKSQFSLSSDQEARDTGEKLSAVNHNGDGSETIQSLSPTGKNGIGTTTSTGSGDLSHADIVAHGHVNDSDHSVAPGPRDNSPLVNNHLANGIVKGNTVGVLTMNKGEYTFTVVTGRLQPANGLSMPSDVQLIQKALDNFQNQYQQQ